MNLTEAISYRMNRLANERGVSLNEIIKRAKLNQSTISEIVQGRSKHPRVSTIRKFCKGAGITMNEFFNDEVFEFLDEDLDIKNENPHSIK